MIVMLESQETPYLWRREEGARIRRKGEKDIDRKLLSDGTRSLSFPDERMRVGRHLEVVGKLRAWLGDVTAGPSIIGCRHDSHISALEKSLVLLVHVARHNRRQSQIKV